MVGEIHSAFGFLENISLWDVTSTVQGVGKALRPITLGAVLIAILVLIITTQLVRHPLLELAILPASRFNPRHRLYAIATITKYLLMLVGGLLVGFLDDRYRVWSSAAVARSPRWVVLSLGICTGIFAPALSPA
ncbi:hypothetical protein MJ561_02950 [Klebsiella pneumoniae]|nr:hypothetical protein MJ561_02950 [Klebsiella pneumoniae]